MIGVSLLIIGVALIAYALHKWTTNCARYFEERNLKYVGLSTALRNLSAIVFKRTDILELSLQTYNEFPNEA